MGTNQRRYSSVVAPISSGIVLPAPATSASWGVRGTRSSSRTSANPGPPVSGVAPAVTRSCEATSASGRTVAKPARVVGTPRSLPMARVMRPALAAGWADRGPLWTIARATRSGAEGCARIAETVLPPADWPASVTRRGSPPNAATSSWTQRSAASWSARPRLRGAPSSTENPSAPSR
ncbi:hypothetical protein D3C74_329690 [compost metagenome]